MANSIEPWIYFGIGTMCLVRGLLRPNRAVVKRGAVENCPGRNEFGACDPAIELAASPGEKTFCAGRGRVVAVGDDFIHVLCTNDPVILFYSGIVPDVVEGQYVGVGQRVGIVDEGGIVRFSVTQLRPVGGGYVAHAVPPSAWLAMRGLRPFTRNDGNGELWCDGGRTIQVPQDVKDTCKMRRPFGGKFGLLPIQVDLGDA